MLLNCWYYDDDIDAGNDGGDNGDGVVGGGHIH